MIDTLTDMLVGAKLNSFGRSCDLLWFNFVDDTRNIFLHSQTRLRILNDGYVVVTSEDIYCPYIENCDFDWQKIGDSVYDVELARFFQGNSFSVVEIQNGVAHNDCSIILNDGVRIELLDNKPKDNEDERWRIFVKNYDYHYVMRNELNKE